MLRNIHAHRGSKATLSGKHQLTASIGQFEWPISGAESLSQKICFTIAGRLKTLLGAGVLFDIMLWNKVDYGIIVDHL